MKTYFLFGESAVEAYDNGGVEEVNNCYENNEFHYTTFCYDSETTKPQELLLAYNGDNDFTIISEEDYNKLKIGGSYGN